MVSEVALDVSEDEEVVDKSVEVVESACGELVESVVEVDSVEVVVVSPAVVSVVASVVEVSVAAGSDEDWESVEEVEGSIAIVVSGVLDAVVSVICCGLLDGSMVCATTTIPL